MVAALMLSRRSELSVDGLEAKLLAIYLDAATMNEDGAGSLRAEYALAVPGLGGGDRER